MLLLSPLTSPYGQITNTAGKREAARVGVAPAEPTWRRTGDAGVRASDDVHHAVVRLLPKAQGPARRDGIEVAEVDIERDPAAADYVMSVNGGMQTVPTVVFPDGTALTNPSAAQVRERLIASH